MPFSTLFLSWVGFSTNDNVETIRQQLRLFAGRGATAGWMGLIILGLVSLPAYGQCDTTWTGPASGGLWNQAADWSAGVPTASTNVCIDNGNAQNSAVTLNIAGAEAANLTIDSGDSLSFNNAASLTINGSSLSNAGSLSLNSTGNLTELIIAAPNVTLKGGGTVTLSNNANNYIFGATGTDTLTNQETIQGAGHIGNGQMTLVNSSIINANQSAGLTIQTSGGTTNTGTIEATAGSTLTLTSTTVTNAGGTISANGGLHLINSTINGGTVTLTGASTLQLTNGVIHSGSTLNNSATGTIEALAGTSTLGGTINNPGTLKIDNAAVLDLENGTYVKLGKVTLNSTGNVTELVIAGPNVTLSGGTVTLSNNANNYIFGATGTDTLTNQETIQGAGHIGNGQMTLVNSSIINANQSAGLTIQTSGGTTNTGTIEATAGSTLTLTSTTVTNAGGTISANGGLHLINSTINGGTVTLTGASTLQLTNGVIHSGSTLNNSATGTIEALAGTSTLGGTINNPGTLKIDNAAVLDLENGTYAKLGKATLNSTGNVTELVIAGPNVTLSGGTVTLSNNANNYIFGATGTDTLTNQETIQGAGHIGNGQMTLVNSSIINANQSAGLTIQTSGGTTNTGTIEATAGSTLTLTSTTVTNAGGTISANGGLHLINSTINGGTVTLTGASTLQLTNGVIHSGSTLNNSATGTIEALAGTSTLGGTINNPGTLKIDNAAVLDLENGTYAKLGKATLNSTGNVTELVIAGPNVTLSGGTVTLSNNANNYIFGATGTDTLTNQETIQGAGHIGNGQMTLVNSSIINANQSAGLTIQTSGGTTNTGTIEATAGSTLTLTSTTVTNAGGTISANGGLHLINSTINGGTVTLTGASTLQLTNGVIHSGSTLNNSATGTIEALAGTSTLGGTINNPGTLKIDNAAVLDLENGTYAKLGKVTLNSTGNVTELVIAGPNVTLSGGTVTLSNNANNYIFGATGTDTLTNQETIQGAGHIGNGQMTLVNSGIINANQSAGIIIQTSGGVTNSGTLQVAAADTMHVLGGPFTNFSGSTLSGGTYTVAGTMQIDQFGTTGGEIVTDAAQITLTGAAAKFVDAAGKDVTTNIATITSAGAFSISGRTYTTVGNFTNNGALTVGAGSKFVVSGNLTNFSGTTLKGGTYAVTGTLQFNGANIINNAASITLTGASSKIVDQTQANALANFANNMAGATFATAGTKSFTTAGALANAGTVKVGKSSTLTVGANKSYTQSAGTTTVDGTFGVTGAGQFNLNAGSVFGNGGTFTGNVISGATFNVGDAILKAGELGITGGYSQSAAGSVAFDIGGLTAGTLFDQFNITGAATLGGKLNLDLINSFIPTIGSTFDIMNFGSETGNFATINGTSINANEHFQVVVNPTNVTLNVVAGPGPPDTASAVNYLSDPGLGNGSRASTTPEPSSLLLLGSGVLAGVVRYRRKAKAH